MGVVLAMRAAIAFSLLTLLAACSSGQGLNPTVAALYENFKPGAGTEEQSPDKKPSGRRLTRAAINKSGLSLIFARLGEDAPGNRLAAVTKNGPFVTYLTRQGQHLTLNGTAITATRGIGHDLLAATSSANDPLKVPTPPDLWPAELRRSYRFSGDGPGGQVRNFACKLHRSGTTDITIVEVTYQTVRFQETCTDETISFENSYFADAKTGFVWRSRQWVSPRLPQIDMNILEPLTE